MAEAADRALPRPPAPHPLAIWALCLLGGFMVGLSGFSSESNHPTYLPPGLRLIDPGFLAGDWWLDSAHHYHPAFFALVAALTRLGALEWGLALLNVVMVAIALHACWRLLVRMESPRPVLALAFLLAVLLATRGYHTVGAAYLFSPSLQPSCLAATATILGLADYLEGRLARAGLWLALAGLFHANFLAVNLAAFGAAHTFARLREGGWRDLLTRDAIAQFVRLLGPTLILAALAAPLILSVQTDPVSPAVAAAGDRIFFTLAVPYHYYPRSYLIKFPAFLALELMGLLWTARAVPDPVLRARAVALQLGFGAVIWSATALTTVVFVPAVARLFLWRLAPFAVLLATLLLAVGLLRIIARTPRDEATAAGDARRLRLSLYALPVLATAAIPLSGQIVPTGKLQPMVLLYGALVLAALLRHRPARPGAAREPLALLPVCALLVTGLLTQPTPDDRSRWSLLVHSRLQDQQEQLFRFVAAATPRTAQFLIPPGLDYFRLQAGRAVVVDYKALPLNRSGLVEWYDRLQAISGTHEPAHGADIDLGYEAADAARLAALRCRYGVTHAVFTQPNRLAAPGWHEVFRNETYRVLASTGPIACPPPRTS